MMNQKKHLVVYTVFYPFLVDKYSYDSYVGEEILQFSKKFETVLIISSSPESELYKELPVNVKAISFVAPKEKREALCLFPFLFTNDFFVESKFIFFKYPYHTWFSNFKLLFSSYLKSKRYEKHLAAILSEYEKSDLVYLFSSWMFENAYAISSYRRKHKNIRAISRAHSLDIYFERAKNNYLPLKLITSKKLDLISFVSKQGERYWCDFLNTSNMLKRAKTISSQLGVTHNYEIHINSLSSQREFVVLTNCWLQPLKRIDLFIEALSNIDGINIKWYHIGDDYGTGYFDTIKQTCNKYLNTKTNISHDFLGRLEYENVLKFYNDTTVDLFVSTSSTEGVPVSMMEAISFGVPIIATDVGGVSEVVINKQNGYLLSPNPTAKEVSSKIVEFYNLSESERLLLRKNAQSLWKEKYDATKNYPKFIDEMLIL